MPRLATIADVTAKPKRAKRDNPEFRLHVAAVTLARRIVSPRTPWTHGATGEKREGHTGAKLKAMGLRAGVPDLWFYADGRLIGCEFKSGRGKLSPDQAAFADMIVANGGSFFIARSVDEFERGLIAHGVPLIGSSLARATA